MVPIAHLLGAPAERGVSASSLATSAAAPASACTPPAPALATCLLCTPSRPRSLPLPVTEPARQASGCFSYPVTGEAPGAERLLTICRAMSPLMNDYWFYENKSAN